jgi:hypothetical protein
MGWTYDCAKDNHADCPDTKEDKFECDCPCHLGDQIQPDDYVSEDGVTWYQMGKIIGNTEKSGFSAEELLHRHADEHQYWPNAWLVSDHGNVNSVKY